MDINKKKKDRFKFLKAIYDAVDGEQDSIIDGSTIGKKLVFERNYTKNIFYYLQEEGLIEGMGAGFHLSITHYGIREVEQSLSEPEKPTEHFLPLNQYNTININNMNGGSFQQATVNSNINIVSNDAIVDIESYIEKIRRFVNDDIEDEELRAELLADVETISQQSKSPKPKKAILKATLDSIKDILVGSLGGVIGTLAIPRAEEFIHYTEQILQQLPR